MTEEVYRAECKHSDCGWSFDHEKLHFVEEAAENHEAVFRTHPQNHETTQPKKLATDGGRAASEDGVEVEAVDRADKDVETLLYDANIKLRDANSRLHSDDSDEALMAVGECMEDLREAVAKHDVDAEGGPLWEISRGDVESYVGCELVDVAFGALGGSVALVFEKEDGDLHGLKLTPRESVKVCDIEVSD